MPQHPLFEIVTTTAGVLSIRNKQVNEIMHNPVGPWKEANQLYIDQSNLRWHLTHDLTTELVIFDVGLGAAANALAILHCAMCAQRAVRIVSFEIDLDLLRFALDHSSQFEHFKGFEGPLGAILSKGYWESENIKWELHHGDFLQCINHVKHHAHIVYYDPYSPKMNQEMWTTECFKKLHNKCDAQAMFYNYSQATPIRAALLEAGFFVGYGIATGLKNSTTQAAYSLDDLEKPLDERWFRRWQRSDTPLPFRCEDAEALKSAIHQHKQFSGITT